MQAVAEAGQVTSFSRRQIAGAITGRQQELIILPTEKCNLRCTYCYEDFAIGKMSNSTQLALERFVERRVDGLDRLSFSWFGGEPLVAKDVVLRLSKFAHRVATERGLAFDGGLTTNGYLLDTELFEELVSYRQNFYQITLDGFGEHHDAVRRFANGRGTFARIWENLENIKNTDLDCEILVRVHVRRENIDHLPMLMRELGRLIGVDPRFRLDFEHVRNLGGEGGARLYKPVSLAELDELQIGFREVFYREAGILGAEEAAAATALAKSLTTKKQMGESSGSRRASEIEVSENYICYASKPNSLMIRADGRIGKCTVALYDDRNTIGKLNDDGTIDLDNAKVRPWIRGLGNMDVETLACPYKAMPKTSNP